MDYQHQIIQNHPRKQIYKFDSDTPYIPSVDDRIAFPAGWKDGEWFNVTMVHHYLVDRLIVINVNKIG
jgi:hypothetical protein